VWKVERVDGDDAQETMLQVHGAEVRDTNVETIGLDEFVARCASAFDAGGCLFDQPFQPRIAEGLVRCYLVADDVVGFARQSADALLTDATARTRIMGLPSAKTMFPRPTRPPSADCARSSSTTGCPGCGTSWI
jgi:hypothetical protein